MPQIGLDTLVQYVKGVGPARAEQLAKLGIETVEDLLMYFPFRFDLRKQVQPMETIKGNESSVTVAGQVVAIKNQGYGRRPFFQCELADGTAFVFAKWFHGGYLCDKIKTGLHLAISGKVSIYKEYPQFINPSFQILWDPDESDFSRDEMLPVYPAGAKLSSSHLGTIIRKVLPQANHLIAAWFRPEFLHKRGIIPRAQAVMAMHHPENQAQWETARKRLAYDECLLMQLGIAILRMHQISRPARALVLTSQIDQRIRLRFPFTLTAAQDKAVTEISADLKLDRPMNRLLQGDVGSGKTVVALHAALLTVARKCQVAIMAPTEILARQHYNKIKTYLAGSLVRTELFLGGQPTKTRARLVDALGKGDIHIAVGTHALLGENIAFSRLGLVVIDEQHKFGVRQRTGIRAKGFAPHYLVMTATPIPRTLAMTVFGDLDVSTIDSLPPGRGKTRTRLVNHDQMDEVMEYVRKKLATGQQAYFIYPIVNASADLELTAAEQAYEELSNGELKDFEVAMVHGQMRSDRKQKVMDEFRSGKVQVLIASVVVEVGVDVPNANIMVIMHADRFGLAQLHQLRGRIGRSTSDAACILVSSPKNPMAKRRLQVLVNSNDGFKIAEEDLRIRGPGQFFGTQQHGLPELKVADLVKDFDLLRTARLDATNIVSEDPGLNNPHNQTIRTAVIKAYAGKLNLLTGG